MNAAEGLPVLLMLSSHLGCLGNPRAQEDISVLRSSEAMQCRVMSLYFGALLVQKNSHSKPGAATVKYPACTGSPRPYCSAKALVLNLFLEAGVGTCSKVRDVWSKVLRKENAASKHGSTKAVQSRTYGPTPTLPASRIKAAYSDHAGVRLQE